MTYLVSYISAFASQPSDNVQIILSLVYDSIYNNFLSGFINFIKYKVFFKNQYLIARRIGVLVTVSSGSFGLINVPSTVR